MFRNNINKKKKFFCIPLLLGNGTVHSDFGIVRSEVTGSGFVNSMAFLISVGEKVFQGPKLGKERAQI